MPAGSPLTWRLSLRPSSGGRQGAPQELRSWLLCRPSWRRRLSWLGSVSLLHVVARLPSGSGRVAVRFRGTSACRRVVGVTQKPCSHSWHSACKIGCGGGNRTREWRFCRPLPYHLATPPQAPGGGHPLLREPPQRVGGVFRAFPALQTVQLTNRARISSTSGIASSDKRPAIRMFGWNASPAS